MFETPILLLMFNRPDHSRKLIEALRPIQPSRIYINADGPRHDRPGEADLCKAVRDTVQLIDWPCRVITRFSDVNLGCRIGVSSGITWFFEQEAAGIILEDDCLPHPDFFPFCAELLERYRFDEGVMMISGNHPQPGVTSRYTASYFFTPYPFIWGWASWRRAWTCYDIHMTGLEKAGNSLFRKDFPGSKMAARYLKEQFRASLSGATNTWDYQWFFAILKYSGVCVLPSVNMIENTGFGEHATHTSGALRGRVNARQGMTFPLRHPDRHTQLTCREHLRLFYIVYKPAFRLLIWNLLLAVKRAFQK